MFEQIVISALRRLRTGIVRQSDVHLTTDPQSGKPTQKWQMSTRRIRLGLPCYSALCNYFQGYANAAKGAESLKRRAFSHLFGFLSLAPVRVPPVSVCRRGATSSRVLLSPDQTKPLVVPLLH